MVNRYAVYVIGSLEMIRNIKCSECGNSMTIYTDTRSKEDAYICSQCLMKIAEDNKK